MQALFRDKLPGFLPFSFESTAGKDCVRLGIMSGAEIELLQLQFATCEWDEHQHNAHLGDVTALSYMLEAILV